MMFLHFTFLNPLATAGATSPVSHIPKSSKNTFVAGTPYSASMRRVAANIGGGPQM
jgi:hypothetical protein